MNITPKTLVQPSVPSRGGSVSSNTLLDQAYNEYCRLEVRGGAVRLNEFLARYPTIQSSLGRLLEIHGEMLKATAWPQAGDYYHGFQLERPLGAGACSRVFLATEPALGNRHVAVKITREGESEAFTLGRVKHPNVIPIYSSTRVPDRELSIICMEYVGSATLCSLLDKVIETKTPPANAGLILEAARDQNQVDEAAEGLFEQWQAKSYEAGIRAFFGDVCLALEYLHRQGILHRDLKPSNILMRPDGAPVILDFHLARDLHGLAGAFGGTYPYMPAEQLRAMIADDGASARDVDERADIFAVGVLLWETLTGKLPFGPMPKDKDVKDGVAEMAARQEAGFKALVPDGWTISPDLVQIVRRCLALDPAERPASAAELRRLLVPEVKPRGQRRWVFAAAAAGLLVAVAAAAPLILGTTGGPAQVETNESVAKRYERGVTFYNAGDAARAAEEFEGVAKARPQNPRGWRALALAKVAAGPSDKRRLAMAFKACLMANGLEETPDFAFTGYLHHLQGDVHLAREQYETALTKKQSLKAVRNNLASLLAELDSWVGYQNALNHADLVLKEDERCQPALINRARAEYRMAIFSKNPPLSREEKNSWRRRSVADLERALEIGPRTGELHYEIARVMAFPPPDNGFVGHLSQALDLGIDPARLDLDGDGAWLLLGDHEGLRKLRGRPRVEQPADATQMQRLLSPRTELPAWER
jgi:serine/threonine protein kinase